MFTENSNRRKRGRPAGPTAEGEATRRRIYESAIALIATRGYEAATLRDVATRAKVSPALLYRYFPNKRAVVLALYDELSERYAAQAEAMPNGRWRDRFLYAVELSLEVLAPHRVTLRALAPLLVGDAEDGVFAERTAFSRARVQAVFERAVAGASDASNAELAGAIGRMLYLLHLGIVLWWLLDRSPGQRATTALVGLFGQILPSATLALRLPPVRKFLRTADALFDAALLGSPES